MNVKTIAIGTILLTVAIGALAWSARAESGAIDIQQAYFVGAAPHDGDMNLTSMLFVTNDDRAASGHLSITVFVVPQRSGLSSFTTRLEVGEIGSRTTQQVSVPVTVPDFSPNESYRIDFLVFEDGLLTQRGSGSVGWGGGWQGSTDLAAGEMRADALSVSAPSFEKVR